MTTIAHRPQDEAAAILEWFKELRKAIEAGDKDTALRTVDAAIRLYERGRDDERTKQTSA